MTYLAFFGFLCLYTDLTINQKDLLTFPNFLGYLLLGILLWLLFKRYSAGKKENLIFVAVCFVFSLIKSLQDAFRFFGEIWWWAAWILRLIEIAACMAASWMVYKTAFTYAQKIRPQVAENKSAALLTIILTAFCSLVSPFFSALWQYSAYIIAAFKLLISLGLIIQVIRFLKVKQNDKTV